MSTLKREIFGTDWKRVLALLQSHVFSPAAKVTGFRGVHSDTCECGAHRDDEVRHPKMLTAQDRRLR